PGVFLCSAGNPFRDGGGQLPLAEITGVSDDLKRLSARRSRESTQNDRQKECSHDELPCCLWMPLSASSGTRARRQPRSGCYLHHRRSRRPCRNTPAPSRTRRTF